MVHELCGVYVKVPNKRPVHRVFQVIQFLQQRDDELQEVLRHSNVEGRTNSTSTQWWFKGRLLLPKNEVCPKAGWMGFSWLTEATSNDMELFMDNYELIVTDIMEWYPVEGVTSARPQIWHPSVLKERKISISGNVESYVVYNSATQEHGNWKLRPMKPTDVISYPEDRLGWNTPYPSLTLLSRSSIKRLTSVVRNILAKGRNKFVGQETMPYTRAEWHMWCERTMHERRRVGLRWNRFEDRAGSFVDGSFTFCNLVASGSEQIASYVGKSELQLIDFADS
jgi:hypothetical protein